MAATTKKAQQLAAPNRLGDDSGARGADAMNLKNILGDIKPDDRYRRQIPDRLDHGRPSSDGL
jgi:hypothetical protein